RLVCEVAGADPELLSALAGPRVVHYTGHRIARDGAGPFRAEDEAAVADAVRAELERHPAAYAYGALASGADLLWAEALLERGAAGAAIDVATWGDGGRATSIVELTPGSSAAGEANVRASTGRVVRAMLFADVRGYSKLGDAHVRRFAESVLGAFAGVLAR